MRFRLENIGLELGKHSIRALLMTHNRILMLRDGGRMVAQQIRHQSRLHLQGTHRLRILLHGLRIRLDQLEKGAQRLQIKDRILLRHEGIDIHDEATVLQELQINVAATTLSYNAMPQTHKNTTAHIRM